MNKRSILALQALTMFAATNGNLFDDGSTPRKKPKPKTFNETKKCFNKDCTNHRTGNSLYCSNECQVTYNKYLKEIENNS